MELLTLGETRRVSLKLVEIETKAQSGAPLQRL